MSLFKKMKAQQTLKLNYKTVKLSADAFAFAQRNTELKDTFDYWHEFSKLNNELNKGIQPSLVQQISLPNSKILHFVL